MRTIRMLFILLLVATVLLGITVLNETDADSIEIDRCNQWVDGWSVSFGDDIVDYKTLPTMFENKKHEPVTMINRMPKNVKDNDSILIFIINCETKVYIDNKEMAEFLKPKDTNSKTPGVGWIDVKLSDDYAGKEIKIVFNSEYNDCLNKVPSVYIGDRADMYQRLLRDKLPEIILALSLVTMGFFIIVAALFINGNSMLNESFFWLGNSSATVGLWILIETRIVTLYLGHPLFFSQITFISLIFMMFSLVNYVETAYMKFNDRVTGSVKIIINCMIAVDMILQIFGILDLRQLNPVFNLIWVIVIILMLVKSALTSKWKFNKNISLSNIVNSIFREKGIRIISLVVISVFVLTAIIGYTFGGINYSLVALTGFFIYVVIQIVGVFQNVCTAYVERAKYANLEEEALKDALTLVDNRMSFEKDCVYNYNSDLNRYSVVMFDLNNLKYFNDTYGHAKGDWYIISCSKVIEEIFGQIGKVYRIGGDEFCAVCDRLSHTKYRRLLIEMHKQISKYDSDEYNGKLGLASGFAKYDYRIDDVFDDIVQRADKEMYRVKDEMKREKIISE